MGKVFRNKIVKIFSIILAVIIIILSVMGFGAYTSSCWKPWQPNYDLVDLMPILTKATLTDEDYDTLYYQTGLTKLGIDGFLQKGDKSTIIEIQRYFFESQSIYYNNFAPFMGVMHRENDSYVPHAILENGDIIFSPSTFLSFISVGHCAMVINTLSKTLICANGYDSPSNVVYFNDMFTRPAFIVLRVNADKETRNLVSTYAKQNLVGLKYDILAGIFEDKAPKKLERTHCSHIIWYAYNQFGIDVDGNGGKIVTPVELTLGENVSIVQVYGIDVNKYA